MQKLLPFLFLLIPLVGVDLLAAGPSGSSVTLRIERPGSSNGSVNRAVLPGGWSAAWTAQRVLKHDGSPFHGLGGGSDGPGGADAPGDCGGAG